MDEYDDTPYRGAEQFVLPTAPRAARGPDISDDRIPRDPVRYIYTLSNFIVVKYSCNFTAY
jgi:hypothetical protein